jgi:hypothetical protein
MNAREKLIELVRELALPRYSDSDPASLLETLRVRAQTLLDETARRECSECNGTGRLICLACGSDEGPCNRCDGSGIDFEQKDD